MFLIYEYNFFNFFVFTGVYLLILCLLWFFRDFFYSSERCFTNDLHTRICMSLSAVHFALLYDTFSAPSILLQIMLAWVGQLTRLLWWGCRQLFVWLSESILHFSEYIDMLSRYFCGYFAVVLSPFLKLLSYPHDRTELTFLSFVLGFERPVMLYTTQNPIAIGTTLQYSKWYIRT